MPHSIIRNESGATVKCRISNYHNAADPEWITLVAKKWVNCNRNAWEFIIFAKVDENEGDTERGGTYVDLRVAKLVEFHAFDKILVF
jgi:hypothetical protein